MTRPNIQIPKEFAINGEKADFTQEKIQTGFDKLNPDIFAGDNLNKFVDDTYKGLNGVLDLYNGVVLHEMTTTYDDKAVVGKFIENSFKLYRSLVNDNTGHEVTETEYWEEVALGGGGSGFNLFDTKISDHILEGEEALGWALQGTYVYKEGVAGSRTGYADFYNKCLAEKENSTVTETTLGDNTITMYVNANGHTFYDIANKDVVDNFYNAIGTAWFYGVDTENERIFLPRNDYFMQLTGDKTQVGESVEAGLPNITGTCNSTNEGQPTGAVTSYYTGSYGIMTANNGGGYRISGIDASKSNPIYGNSDTVQPNAVKQLLYICVGNTKVESAISNVTEITTSENDTLPLFHNFYSKEDMTTTGAYVNASLGSWLSGNVYPTAYEELVNKLGTDNVKSITDEYTDYDFVVNQDDMTFRLPLLNGNEDLTSDAIISTLGLPEKPTSTKSYYTAPYNGFINIIAYKSSTSNTFHIEVNGVLVRQTRALSASNSEITLFVKKGDEIAVYTDSSSTGWIIGQQSFIKATGNGNLYYKVANAVTNLELLDVGEVTNAINNKADLNLSNITEEAKTQIVDYGFPDWAKLTMLSSGTIYHAVENLYIGVHYWLNGAESKFEVGLSPDSLITFAEGTTNVQCRGFYTIPVAKGYYYRITTSIACWSAPVIGG